MGVLQWFMKKNNGVIPWIGYSYFGRVFADVLEEELGVVVDTDVKCAKSGLELIASREFPLIMVNDLVIPGEFNLPDDYTRENLPEVSRYLVGEIRRSPLNSRTPIIATVIPIASYTLPEDYLEAGANDVFTFDNTAELIACINKYLL